jgi:hypothetical protein
MRAYETEDEVAALAPDMVKVNAFEARGTARTAFRGRERPAAARPSPREGQEPQ